MARKTAKARETKRRLEPSKYLAELGIARVGGKFAAQVIDGAALMC